MLWIYQIIILYICCQLCTYYAWINAMLYVTSVSIKLKTMRLVVRGHPRWMDHGEEFWQNMVHWRMEWQTTSAFLPWEPYEQYEKAKRYGTERWTPPVGRCQIYLAFGKKPRNSSKKIKRLCQSGNDAQLCVCVVVKVKSYAVKNNIA